MSTNMAAGHESRRVELGESEIYGAKKLKKDVEFLT